MSDLTLQDDGKQLTTDVEGYELVIRYGWQGDDVMRVDFVGVPSALGGRGLGTKLVGKLVFKLVPVCGFARTQIDRHQDWKDVLA